MEQIDLDELPVLKGQMIPPMAAQALRRTRQRVDQMMREGKIRYVSRVPGTTPRAAAYVIREAEVRRLAAESFCPSCAYLKEHGETVTSCDHFSVGTDGVVTIADIPQVADAGPVEHAVPFAVVEHAAQA